ncbi:hypothetical protein CFP56_008687 [Quercus suber]|uniref:Uncharacterized protein n=1 Tax=Quercus suber TaxID=58331 RepID=A0AAW0M772_QUESU
MGSLDVDRRHVAVEHGGEVEWVRSRRCWGATSEPDMKHGGERETASFDPFLGNITFARPHLVKERNKKEPQHAQHATDHTPSKRSSGTTKNAVVFGDSDLQVTKPSSDLSEAKNAVVFLQSFELRQKNKTFCVFRSGFDSISHPVA